MQNLIYAAVDVDNKAFHVAIFDPQTSKMVEFKCKPDAATLVNKLETMIISKESLKLCYEATYLGFDLCRRLHRLGIACEVIAPSLIPELAGKRTKTDRLDSRKLAEFYAKGLLTTVSLPDEQTEVDRDLIRARAVVVRQLSMLKNHVTSYCRRRGFDFQKETGLKMYWSKGHEEWLERKMNQADSTTKLTLSLLLRQFHDMNALIKDYDHQIEMLAETPRYQEKVQALNCYRGIKTTTTMTIITEFGDIRRFGHPKRMAAYVGLDVAEYSSGGHERKFGLSKTGNCRIRTALIESCQYALYPPVAGKKVRERRKGVPQKYIKIADRCMERLNRKATRMLYKGKPRNKIKAACAREMLGFIWESLREVA